MKVINKIHKNIKIVFIFTTKFISDIIYAEKNNIEKETKSWNKVWLCQIL